VNAPAAPACRNCGAPAGDAYCPRCGQETAAHPPSAAEFLHEFVGHYVALEGALWRTLKKLFVPGRLTLEYFAGRRRSYVLPLRLYLTCSVVFFLVAKVLTPSVAQDMAYTSYTGTATIGSTTFTYTCKRGIPLCDALNEKARGNFAIDEKVYGYVLGRLVAYAPYAMFFLLPVFALITRAVYWNRPRNYGEHLVFAFHFHSFVFLLAALVVPLQILGAVSVVAAIYLAVAMKRVFGGRTWVSVLRFLFVFLAYFVLITLTLSAIFMAVVFS
jgi:uncharacterized protein DUF3667